MSRTLALALILTLSPIRTSPADETALQERLAAAVRQEVDAKHLPALSIALVDGDRVVWSGGFGFQDAARTLPATADTIYRVGSVSKLFTDMAIMQLVEEGRLDLDVPVTRYLPDFQPRNPFETDTPVTLRQLMSHRSGLVREPPVGHYFDPDEPTLAATVASLNDTTLVYPPGTRTKYSNAGIAVLGLVLAQELGIDYAQTIQERLLLPLEMTHSGFERTPAIDAHLATAWMWTYDGQRFVAPEFALGTAPAGNMYASVLDLAKFLSCLFRDGRTSSGAILQPQTLQTMMTPLTDADGRPQGFGLGFHVQSLDGHRKVGHGGAVYGFSTHVEALPDSRLGVAAVASLDGSNGVVSRLSDYALRLMLADKAGEELPTYQVTQPVPVERARALPGEYQSGARVVQVTELGGRVWLHDGAFRFEVRASAHSGELITDDVLGSGTPVRMLDDGGLAVGQTPFTRRPDTPPAECPEPLRGLIGEYGWDHNILYIHEVRGELWALIEWFYDYPLKQVADNVFAFPDYGLYHGEQLLFQRDADGRGTEVVAAEVRFRRRETGTRDGQTYRITPVRPIDELRSESLQAVPPVETGEFRETDLVEPTTLDPTIRLDIRYASTDNFTGAEFYQQPRAFLERPAAQAVVRAHQRLKERGLGLLIHDAYRPWHVTRMFWEATPAPLRHFVANPANGSRHNRGCAVDLTLCDLATGLPVTMVSGYDEFSTRAYPQYPGGTARQKWHRDLLRRTMEAEGFAVYEFEWWHFDYQDWKRYRIGNRTFEAILNESP